jgi:phosphate/sulfate permease
MAPSAAGTPHALANRLKYLSFTKTGNEKSKNEGSRTLDTANVGPGSRPAFYELLVLKFIVRNPALYAAPEGNKPPPLWIRGILIATCTGVSFAHGSNDGQKGMGLIMLILIGTVPTAYALNRTLPESQVKGVEPFARVSVTLA